MEPAEGSYGQEVRVPPWRVWGLRTWGPSDGISSFSTEMLHWMWSQFMLSALTGREMSEPDLSPAHSSIDRAASCGPEDLEKWRLSFPDPPCSGALGTPVTQGPPEQRCQIPRGILKIYLGQEID